jgi:hypothetical protein
MLPEMLQKDRKRAGWSVGQAAWRLGVNIREYREIGSAALTDLRHLGPDLQAVRLAADVRCKLFSRAWLPADRRDHWG